MRTLNLFFVLLATTLSLAANAQPCTQQVVASYSPTIVCTGGNLQLNVTTIAGAGYSWAGPAGFNSNQQNPQLFNVNITAWGDYIVTVTDGSCTYKDTVTVTVNPTPTLPFVVHNSPVCYGDTITMAETNTGMIPYNGYWWGPNNFSALTAPFQPINRLYADSSMSGQYKIVTQSLAGCFSDTTYFNISVLHTVTPFVTIKTDTVKTGPFTPVTFTSQVVYGGPQPTYQWRKNSQDIAGATSDTWTGVSGVTLMHGDTITVAVTADTACGESAISNLLIYYLDLGVDDVRNNNGITLYPNPNDGRFSLLSTVSPGEGDGIVEIMNAVGTVVYKTAFSGTGQQEIFLPPDISNGVYLLRVHDDGRTYHTRFTLNR